MKNGTTDDNDRKLYGHINDKGHLFADAFEKLIEKYLKKCFMNNYHPTKPSKYIYLTW